MSGISSFGVSQKKEPAGGGVPGPPFAIGSAANGLSVDPVSGKIVLGNDPTGIAGPAALLGNREIDFAGFSLGLIDTTFAPISTAFGANDLQLFDTSVNAHLAARANRLLIEDTVLSQQTVIEARQTAISDLSFENDLTADLLQINELATGINTSVTHLELLASNPVLNVSGSFKADEFKMLDITSAAFFSGTASGFTVDASGDNLSVTAASIILNNGSSQQLAMQANQFVVQDIPSGDKIAIGINDLDIQTPGTSETSNQNSQRIFMINNATNDTGLFSNSICRITDGSTGKNSRVTGVTVESGGDIHLNNPAYMLRSLSAMTNGAGALVGTLNNSPKVGNPTKWIAFDDNSTIRFIPAW